MQPVGIYLAISSSSSSAESQALPSVKVFNDATGSFVRLLILSG